MALELQKKNLYVFMAAEHNGTTFSQQLRDAGVQIGWPHRLVPFGPDISSAIFAVGFATRAALSFGGIQRAISARSSFTTRTACLHSCLRLETSATNGTQLQPVLSTMDSRL